MAARSRVGRFEILRRLGRGANATVKLAVDTATDHQVALKIMKAATDSILQKLLAQCKSEIEALNRINHPNVVRIFEVNENALYQSKSGKAYSVLYIAMELLVNGELFDVLFYSGRMEEALARTYFRQILCAIHACHANGVTHRDLKPENILFDSEYDLKLADFGFAAPTTGRDGSGRLYTFIGTEAYMAPEILRRDSYSGEAVDMFSCGVILFILLSQHPAFGKALETDRYYCTFVQDNERFWAQHSRTKPAGFYSAEFKDLINHLLAYNSSDRLTAEQTLSHPWMAGTTVPIAEAKAALAQRCAFSRETKRREEEEKAKRRVAPAATGRNYRGNMGETPEDLASLLSLAPLPVTTNKFTQFYTHLPARHAFQLVNGFFANKEATILPHDTKYKAKCQFETEDGEGVALVVELFDAGDGKICVDFLKDEGPTYAFVTAFQELVADFEKETTLADG